MGVQSSRDVGALHPHVAFLCQQHMERCAAIGIPFMLTFTTRSIAEQNALYAQGRTKPGKIVTNARGGSSFHNFGLAYDGLPLALAKLPNWGDTRANQKETDRIWDLYGAVAVELGLTWGGNFKSIRDRPHCEWNGGLSLAELRAGKTPALVARA